jgi:hypothetical protein
MDGIAGRVGKVASSSGKDGWQFRKQAIKKKSLTLHALNKIFG